MPLNFLDHHIKCGNSLIGSFKDSLKKGVPDKAFTPVRYDNKVIAKRGRNSNKDLPSNTRLEEFLSVPNSSHLSLEYEKVSELEEIDVTDIEAKKEKYEDLIGSSEYKIQKLAADAWTSVFFWNFRDDSPDPPLSSTINTILRGRIDTLDTFTEKIKELSDKFRFFHWDLEFPDVFNGGSRGFDCVLGNPPWDMIKENSTEFFSFYEPLFTKELSSKQKKDYIKKVLSNPSISEKWSEYQNTFDHMIKFFIY